MIVSLKTGYLILTVSCLLVLQSSGLQQQQQQRRQVNDAACLKQLTGNIEDCDCDIEQIDKLNNYHVYPLLNELLKKDYFRYFRVNLYKVCQFWPSDALCTLKDCQVKTCEDDDLPSAYKKYGTNLNQNGAAAAASSPTPSCEQSNPLGQLNETISVENPRVFEDWQRYDDAQENFCEPDDEYLSKAQYVDLTINQERYTGYKGEHAHKIWGSIYKENCFKDSTPKLGYQDLHDPTKNTCLEKRVFYRLISGLHTSINVHLCARYLHKGSLNQDSFWGPNYDEFYKRFDPANTSGLSISWLKNLYFIYMVELRAIVKASSYLERDIYFTGNSEIDEETRSMMLNLLNKLKSFSCHFDESIMFKGDSVETQNLKVEVRNKFRNITKIMDCVGCDKCRVWGKMQTQAVGTSLKILFSGKKFGYGSTIDANESKQQFQLSRYEIVALLNGFGRLSTSISELERFKNPPIKGAFHKREL